MKTRKAGLLALLATVVAFAGCASGPAFEEYESQMQAVGDGKGRIYMYRPSSLGAAVKPAIRVNGDAVGTSSAKGFFYVDLPPGDYTIAASTEAKRSLDVTLDAGEEMYVRLEMKMGAFVGHVKPVLVEASVGKEEIKKTKYAGE
ncbi:MAG: DUF2846 domain-containing protein [Woeseiaceae bacterium]|nr:DUF2846 domain-containing protein [Woeseiaceae bacterium]